MSRELTGASAAVRELSVEALAAGHRDALLRFERDNRRWFARWVPDRGDDYFADFDGRLRALLDEQRAGSGWYGVVVDASGAVLGRVNLADVADGEASLGYRVAGHAAAGGVATSAVRETLGVAAALGLRRVTAMTTVTNVASQTVLTRNGFVPCAGEPAELDGQPAVHYERLAP